jgi:hypothetical protein
MATPVFKFQHPDLTDEDLYFIHNTFFELPETIPMDLTTFIVYHIKTGRTLSGLLICWENLKKSGASLYESTFDEFYTDDEKIRLFDLAKNSGAIKSAKENEFLSEKIKSFIDNKLYETQSFLDFIEETAKIPINNFRSLDYYKLKHDSFIDKLDDGLSNKAMLNLSFLSNNNENSEDEYDELPF